MTHLLCLALLLFVLISSTLAGERELHGKVDYFSWEEVIAGEDFIKEKGWIYTVGGSYTGSLTSFLDLRGLLEIWGGALDYDGVKVVNSTPLHSTTAYFGTREELLFLLRLSSGNFDISPFTGAGHKYWIRTRSDEEWNTFYAKGGARISTQAGKVNLFAGGGVSLPFSTWVRTDWTSSGFGEFVTRPKSLPGFFAQAGFRVGRVTISFDYDEIRYASSDKVLVERKMQAPSGVVLVNSTAFQPDSNGISLGLNFEVAF